jgi:predicted enzyme related to lactoylglutathione lyase
MRERTYYPPGVPCWIDLMEPDVDAAAAFYAGMFGWELEDRMPPGAPGKYCVARLRGADVAAIGGPYDGDEGPVWNTYVAVENADDAAKRVVEAGGRVLVEPTDALNAGRYASLVDPSGASFSVWQARDHIGARLVNEPGSWNFSDLNCRDLEAAGRFYGEVFGWEVEDFAMGESRFTIFRLPGYGEFLLESNPELREQLESDGAPSSFMDAVALLVRESDASVPPHWSVTFAVDDADAAASRAEGLGATVLVPPFDAEPVRMTILADPQGAVFTASMYQPGGSG